MTGHSGNMVVVANYIDAVVAHSGLLLAPRQKIKLDLPPQQCAAYLFD